MPTSARVRGRSAGVGEAQVPDAASLRTSDRCRAAPRIRIQELPELHPPRPRGPGTRAHRSQAPGSPGLETVSPIASRVNGARCERKRYTASATIGTRSNQSKPLGTAGNDPCASEVGSPLRGAHTHTQATTSKHTKRADPCGARNGPGTLMGSHALPDKMPHERGGDRGAAAQRGAPPWRLICMGVDTEAAKAYVVVVDMRARKRAEARQLGEGGKHTGSSRRAEAHTARTPRQQAHLPEGTSKDCRRFDRCRSPYTERWRGSVRVGHRDRREHGRDGAEVGTQQRRQCGARDRRARHVATGDGVRGGDAMSGTTPPPTPLRTNPKTRACESLLSHMAAPLTRTPCCSNALPSKEGNHRRAEMSSERALDTPRPPLRHARHEAPIGVLGWDAVRHPDTVLTMSPESGERKYAPACASSVPERTPPIGAGTHEHVAQRDDATYSGTQVKGSFRPKAKQCHTGSNLLDQSSLPVFTRGPQVLHISIGSSSGSM